MKNKCILIFLMMVICGCGLFRDRPRPAPEPTHVILKFEAADDINPNIGGRASSVMIRIYQLKSYSDFKNADFLDLYNNDKLILGRDLVEEPLEVYLNPSENRTMHFVASDDVRTIGLLAAFRNYDKGNCKTAASIRKNKTTVIHVSVNGSNIQLK